MKSKSLINHRIKKRRTQTEQEQDRECIFKPETSVRFEQSSIKEIKGLEQFVERQKLGMEARKEKEKLQFRNNADNWASKTAIIKGMSTMTSVIIRIIVDTKRENRRFRRTNYSK